MNKYFLLSLITLSACTVADPDVTEHFWLDAGVVRKVRNPAEQLTLPKPHLEFSDGGTVSTCEQYLKRDGDFTETVANYAARSHYLICDALKLAAVRPPETSREQFNDNLDLCSTIDLTSFRHSLRPQIEKLHATLSDLPGSKAVDGLGNCILDGEGRNFVLNAVLLVKEQQKPQRLWVWVTDEILDATYRAYTPVWFVFDQSKNLWVAEQ